MNPFPLRQQHLQKWLTDNNQDFFLVTKPENIRWLTGFVGSFGLYWQGKTSGILLTDSRYAVKAKAIAARSEVDFLVYDRTFAERFASIQRGAIACEDTQSLAQYKRLQKQFSQADITSHSNVIEQFRRQKDNQELEQIRAAQAHVDDILFPFLREVLTSGVSEQEVDYRLRLALQDQGRFGLSFDPIVAFGANAASPHHISGEEKLSSGDCILVDCGVISDGYCSDMTRNAFFGTPSEHYLKAYANVLQAQEKTLRKCKVGIQVADLDTACRRLLGKDAALFTHSLGHGVGLEIHEIPGISEKSTDVLLENEVITIEPGVYIEGKFGIRIEDIGVVMKNSFEVFSKSSKELLVLGG